jgi:rhodanese-related sulfurtransferase
MDRHLILVCHEGYQSSLAAATAQDLGFTNATDLIGGFLAWRDAGLPVEHPPAARPTSATAPARPAD